MFYYKIHGIYLASDHKFDLLTPISHNEASALPCVSIVASTIPNEYISDRECESRIHSDISYLSNSTCRLLIERGEHITYELKKDGNTALLESYLLGWGLAILFYQRKELVFHCSCIAGSKGAVLICGDSGTGKSTTTAGLLQNGFQLMSDDMTVVSLRANGQVIAQPAFPIQKLCPDTISMSKIGQNNTGSVQEIVAEDKAKEKYYIPYSEDFFFRVASCLCHFFLICHRYRKSDPRGAYGAFQSQCLLFRFILTSFTWSITLFS